MSRTVLVTGASNGIGRAIAARFAADGAQVTITGRRADRVAAAAEELAVRGVSCDATDPLAVAGLAAQFERLDVLVNAAGGNTDFETADGEEAGLEQLARQWRANLDANLIAAVLTAEAVRDKLANPASVVSISSLGAERGAGSYGAAKAALAAWNAGLSAELGHRGVTANVISPGYIAGTNFFRGRLSPQRYEQLIAQTHDKRPGRPEDVAGLAYFLASADARHITGQTIHLNGGAFTTR
jgi:NAD(P)-dependent dehydrogenase (short-subunit alcohol dehydrogenase family)